MIFKLKKSIIVIFSIIIVLFVMFIIVIILIFEYKVVELSILYINDYYFYLEFYEICI